MWQYKCTLMCAVKTDTDTHTLWGVRLLQLSSCEHLTFGSSQSAPND